MNRSSLEPTLRSILAGTGRKSCAYCPQGDSIPVGLPNEHVVFSVGRVFGESTQLIKRITAHTQSLVSEGKFQDVRPQPDSPGIEACHRGSIVLKLQIEKVDRLGRCRKRSIQGSQYDVVEFAIGMEKPEERPLG